MSMQKGSFWVWLLTALTFGAIGWYAHELKPVKVKSVAVKSSVPAVAVEEVASEIFNPPEEFVGHVEPVQEVDLLPQIDGYLKEIHFIEGDTVKKGDLLFVIDPERYRASDSVARASLEQAKGKVSEVLASVDRAERYLNRLNSTDGRGISQSELDAAETSLAAEKAALASAKATVLQAEAKIAESSFALKHTKVYAPISGRIGKALMHAGDYVSPSKGALARIVQIDPMRVTFSLTDRAYLAWVSAVGEGAKVNASRLRLRLANGQTYPFDGTWSFSDNEMSVETATITVRTVFPNPHALLIPKAYVTVLADEADPKPAPTVPVLAVVKHGGKTGVWVVGAENKVSFREIGIGGTDRGRVRVSEGVKPGEVIVVQGVHKLGDGLSVRIVPASDFH